MPHSLNSEVQTPLTLYPLSSSEDDIPLLPSMPILRAVNTYASTEQILFTEKVRHFSSRTIHFLFLEIFEYFSSSGILSSDLTRYGID